MNNYHSHTTDLEREEKKVKKKKGKEKTRDLKGIYMDIEASTDMKAISISNSILIFISFYSIPSHSIPL